MCLLTKGHDCPNCQDLTIMDAALGVNFRIEKDLRDFALKQLLPVSLGILRISKSFLCVCFHLNIETSRLDSRIARFAKLIYMFYGWLTS